MSSRRPFAFPRSGSRPTGSTRRRRGHALRWSTTLLLLLIATASVALSWRFGTARMESASGSIRRALERSALPVERITGIEIERPDRVPLRLARRGEGWVEAEPSGLPVDPFIVREAIAAAATLEVSRVVPATSTESDPMGRARLGLDDPAVVTFLWEGGSTSIRLGRLGVAGRAFIEVTSASVDDTSRPKSVRPARTASAATPAHAPVEALVVGRELHDLIVGDDPAQWRLRTLFPEAGAETVAIGFEAGETMVELRRQGARWEMTTPVATRADAAVVNAWLGSIARAECDGWLRDLGTADDSTTLRAAGLLAPSGRFSISSRSAGGERERTLLIGAETSVGGGDRFGMLEGHPALMQLGASTLQTLFQSPLMLIEPTAVGIARADIREIVIGGPAGTFTLRRDLDRWISPEAGSTPLDGRRITTLLQRLVDARAGSISLQPIPPDLVVGRILLRGFDDEALAEIVVATDASGTHWALESGDGVARIFPASMAPSLDPAEYGITLNAPIADQPMQDMQDMQDPSSPSPSAP